MNVFMRKLRRVSRIELNRKATFFVFALFIIFFAFATQSRSSVFSSPEVTFTDASQSGLAIVPASCPSDPHFVGDCTNGYSCPDGSSPVPAGSGNVYTCPGVGVLCLDGTTPIVYNGYLQCDVNQIPPPAYLTYSCSPDGTSATLIWAASPGATTYYPRFWVPYGSCPAGWIALNDGHTCYINQYGATSIAVPTTPGVSYGAWVHAGDPIALDASGQWAVTSLASFSCPASASSVLCPNGTLAPGGNTASCSCAQGNATACGAGNGTGSGTGSGLGSGAGSGSGGGTSGGACTVTGSSCNTGNSSYTDSCGNTTSCQYGCVSNGAYANCNLPSLPKVSFTVTPPLVHKGDIAKAAWTISGNATSIEQVACSVQGPSGDSASHQGGPGDSFSVDVGPIQAQTIFTLDCQGVLDGAPMTLSATVSLIPGYTEQ